MRTTHSLIDTPTPGDVSDTDPNADSVLLTSSLRTFRSASRYTLAMLVKGSRAAVGVVAVLAIAVAVGACGGGKESQQATPTPKPVPSPVALQPEPRQGFTLGDPAFEALPGAKADFGRLGGTVYQIEMPDN